jgi:hypothetical protein
MWEIAPGSSLLNVIERRFRLHGWKVCPSKKELKKVASSRKEMKAVLLVDEIAYFTRHIPFPPFALLWRIGSASDDPPWPFRDLHRERTNSAIQEIHTLFVNQRHHSSRNLEQM